MRLNRVYVDAPLSSGSLIELPVTAAQHLGKVLRARSGDEIVVFTGDGREFAAVIESIRGSRVAASVGDGRQVDRESPLCVTLVQCVPRGDRMDFIVQKATELGVARIVPVLSQRSVVRLDKRPGRIEGESLARRSQSSACEQCGRNRLPVIERRGSRCSTTSANRRRAPLRLVLEPESAATPHGARSALRSGSARRSRSPSGRRAASTRMSWRRFACRVSGPWRSDRACFVPRPPPSRGLRMASKPVRRISGHDRGFLGDHLLEPLPDPG